MLLYLQFNWITILITIALIVPLAIYIIRSQHTEPEVEVIPPADNPLKFDDLAPVDEAEQSEAYLKALRWALGNRKIQNVAITGPYGSGKSSILETFRKTYAEDFSFLNISLASFSDNHAGEQPLVLLSVPGSVKTEGEETNTAQLHQEQRKNEAQQLIELSILQQIFYHVNEAQIPDSRFKRISSLAPADLGYFVAGTVAFLFSAIVLLFPKQTSHLSFIAEFSTAHTDAWFLLLMAMFLPGLVWLIVSLLHFFRNTGLKKLNISSGEIEINPKSEASILNKYLDELVYFFSATRFNVVFIEDMDRFDDPEIFTKLRELNTLLNNSSQVRRRIIFVYAIRDNMFPDDRTRTKFFDFIIPVIPVINWSNSLQKLKDKLDSAGFRINPRFITSITLYIDDMRVLKNIFNELMLYKETLTIPPERQTKLLAMIAYKNIYPHDFADLHEEEGIVFDIFTKAQTLRTSVAADFEVQIAEKKKQIEAVQSVLPSNIKELRAAYIQGIIDQLPEFNYFYFDNDRTKYADLQGDTLFAVLKSGKNVQYLRHQSGVVNAKYKFEDVEANVFPGATYDQREQFLSGKTGDAVAKLNAELTKLNAARAKVSAYSITEIIRLKPGEFPEIAESKKVNRLLRYLLWEGFIDLSYPYLISYFYPGSIGRPDMEFLTYVNDRTLLPFEYELEQPEGVIDMLADYDFEREAIFNIGLLDSLLKGRTKYALPGDRLIAQLHDGSKRGLEFIERYIADGAQVPLFIRLLCKQWPAIFSYYSYPDNETQTGQFLQLILAYSDEADIEAVNVNQEMSQYIESHFELVAGFLPKIPETRIAALLIKLKIEFTTIVATEETKLLLELAYDGNHYVFSAENISVIIKARNKAELNLEELATANYSTILKSDCEPLVNYVDQEISAYVNRVLFKLPGELQDTEKDVISLLNDEDLDPEQKKQLIFKEAAVILNLEDVDLADLYPLMLESNKVRPNWQNVLYYFHTGEEIDPHLLKFLDWPANAAELGKSSLVPDSNYVKEMTDKLQLAVILTDAIVIGPYHSLLKAFAGAYEDLDVSAIAADKVEALIDAGLIAVNAGNFTRLKAKGDQLHIYLLLDDPGAFLDNTEDFTLDNADRLLLLTKGEMTGAEQLQLIGTITPEMITASAPLATRISEILVEAGKLTVDEERLTALIATGSRQREKLLLFERNLSGLDTGAIRELLTGIGGDYERLNRGKRPVFPRTPLNESIARQLKAKDYITSHPVDDEKGTIKMVARS
jgi:energy-coupling factor transporter ATP-binding protein EcfA2